MHEIETLSKADTLADVLGMPGGVGFSTLGHPAFGIDSRHLWDGDEVAWCKEVIEYAERVVVGLDDAGRLLFVADWPAERAQPFATRLARCAPLVPDDLHDAFAVLRRRFTHEDEISTRR